MNVYTDPQLLDIAGAMDRLPDLPLDGVAEKNVAGSAAVGSVAPDVAPTTGDPGPARSATDHPADSRAANDSTNRNSVTSSPAQKKSPVTAVVTGRYLERVMGIEPTTTALATQCSTTELHPLSVLCRSWCPSRAASTRRGNLELLDSGGAPSSGAVEKVATPKERDHLDTLGLETLPPAFLTIDDDERPRRASPGLFHKSVPCLEERSPRR